MTTSEIPPPATGPEEEAERKPAGDGDWHPTGPPTGSWTPYAPPPTGSWTPYLPPPTGSWTPYAPPPVESPVQPGNGFTPSRPDTGVWVRGRMITQLWSCSGSPGVWAWVQGLGWKRLAASETGYGPLISLAVLARTHGTPVAFHEDEAGQIDQLLV